MDKLGIHIPSLVVYVVNFLLLLGILYVFGYKRILGIMDQRTQRIKESLESADRAKEEASRAQEQIKLQMDESRRESQRLLEQDRESSARYREEEHARAQEEVNTFLAKARNDIQRERDRTIEEVRQNFSGLAITAAEKIIQRSLDPAGHQDLIQQVLKEGTEIGKEG